MVARTVTYINKIYINKPAYRYRMVIGKGECT